MASACVNSIGVSPEKFPTSKCRSYGWLSPRISLSRDEAAPRDKSGKNRSNSRGEKPDLEHSGGDFVEFEFRLDDPVTMLPADELFSDGKLVPTELSSSIRKSNVASLSPPVVNEVKSSPEKFRRSCEVLDPYLCSPKAPRCSSRWKEMLGLKKLYQNSNAKPEDQKSTRSIRSLLHRSSKCSDSSLNLPLLKDLENESSVALSISSRLSLSSSSSSGLEHEDLPRLSLDLDKPITRNVNMSRVRLVKHKSALENANANAAARAGRSSVRRVPELMARGVSVDSPRINSSGKIVFHSLERSSSSPSTFNGGPRYKQRGMERSYSANVRVTPVLNVPVCRFPLFSSQSKRETGVGGSKSQLNYNKNSRTSDHRI